MKNRIMRRFLKVMGREERGMNKILLKCGLALALTFAGFLYSHIRTRKIKPSATSPRRHPSCHGKEVNSGGGVRAASNSCSTVSEENILDTEETCINKVIGKNSPLGHSPRTKQSGEKDEFLQPEVETPRSAIAYASHEKDDYEQEIRQLRNMIRMLQERERSLEVQLLEYCGLREQETAVMELQNRLKISNMEAKMFHLKVETLQSENRRLEAQVADHAKVQAELETAKTKVKFLKKKIKYEAEHSREHIINLSQRVAKLQDLECKAANSDQDIQMKLKRLKDLESEAEQLRKSNLRLQMDNSDLAQRLDSTQILANSILEDPEADALKEEGERLKQENESLMKEIEQLHADRCSDLEELVYLRWINACLRHEVRHYQPPPGKTAARDLSKSLSPTSEKKAKQLILEYANNDGRRSLSDFDYDQWSSSQASFITDSDDFSPRDNPSDAKANTTSKSKFFGKLMKLIRGRGSQHQLSRVTSQEKSGSQEDINSPSFSLSISTGNDTGAEGLRSEYATPIVASRTSSLNLDRTLSLKDENRMSVKDESRRNSDVGSSKNFSPRKRGSGDLKNRMDSLPDSPGSEKSNLVKYAEAIRDSSGTVKQQIRRRSASYSSF
ncbi:protein CHUP1, chloroplastic-like isoform X2 [Gastrolobium bilobum]|uniref:protein CHUP1, chloroplastic-like isoform X2 n=1 Tax=Gastrolobium bilobum TaxID=150636 RepID=UPI002AAFCFC6|nr:protein CHUP1, chloroplastic-like isoform X2 [Gastrolobium bilobum]